MLGLPGKDIWYMIIVQSTIKKKKLLFMVFHVGSLSFHIVMIVAKNNILQKRKARSNTAWV